MATPGTIERTYTDKLITSFAEGVKVVKQGSRGLVDIAEAKLRGENVSHADIDAEIGPLFENSASTDLDVVVLGCTHFPILLDELEECSPHKIIWLDSGEAIANRVWEITSEFPNREAPNNSKCKIFFTEMNNLVAAQLESLEKLNMEVEAE